MPLLTQSRKRGTTEPLRKDQPDQWTRAGYYDPEFKDAICAELQRLAGLPKNWDCYGAPPISKAIIAAASKFVRALPENIAIRPRVVPMSTGNLQFEWNHGKKSLELEFESPHTIHFLQWDSQQGIEEEDTFRTTDIDRAVDLIQWFMIGICL
jgi:hypothetical protein